MADEKQETTPDEAAQPDPDTQTTESTSWDPENWGESSTSSDATKPNS